MISRLWIINSVLCLGILYISWNAYEVWTSPLEMNAALNAAEKSPSESRPISSGIKKRAIPSESAFEVIPAKNLFSPEREEYIPEEENAPETEKVAATPAKVSGKKIDLYGVLMRGDLRKALINNPDPKVNDRPNIWVKEGDVLGQFRIDSIQKERLILVDGNTRYEILLYDEKKDVPRQASLPAENSVPQVIRTQPGGSVTGKRPKVDVKDSEPGYEMVKTPFGYVKQRKKTHQ
jgi:hypothetical protein